MKPALFILDTDETKIGWVDANNNAVNAPPNLVAIRYLDDTGELIEVKANETKE